MIKNKKNREKIQQLQMQKKGGSADNDIAIIEERRNSPYQEGMSK